MAAHTPSTRFTTHRQIPTQTDPAGSDLQKLQGTDYLANGYATLNFNDAECSFVTLFCVLVVNNWFVIVDGFAAVSNRDLARVYFLAFYVVGVLLFLNIVVAFILDAFLSEYNKARSSRGW